MTKEVLKYLIRVLKSKFATKEEIPTKTSDLTNDNGFLSSVPEEYVTETELNAKGYLTEHQDISGKADKLYVDTELAKKSDKTHTHSYNDLSDKPVIPSIDGLATKKELTDGLATKSDTTHTHDQYLTEHQDISGKADKSEIPTKTSQLQNDSGYLTSIPSEYVTETELNSKGYLTEVPSEYITEEELNAEGYLTEHQSLENYALKTELPTKTSQLTNDSGYLTQHQDISGKVDKINGKGLSTNDYTTEEKNKLNGIEENANNYSLPIASSTVLGGIKVGSGLNIDSNGVLSSSGGSSSDLSNYQTKTDNALTTTDKTIVGAINELDIESVKAEDFEDSSVIIENNLTSRVSNLELTKADISYVDTQIANAQLGGSGGSTNIDLSNYATKDEIPTKTSQLTNDSNFATESYVTDAINNASLGGGEGSSVDLSLYQTKTDNTLTTTNKTIVGAINELDIEGIKAEDYNNDPVVVGNNLVARVSALETNESEVLSRVNSLESNKADVSTVSALEASKADVSRVSALETNKADKSSIPTSLPANGGNSNTVGGFSIWVGTQSEYDSISTKSSTTLYFIREV